MFREEREEETYVIQSITFQDQVSVSFNQLNQRQSLNEFRIFLYKMYALIFCRKYQTTWRAAGGG